MNKLITLSLMSGLLIGCGAQLKDEGSPTEVANIAPGLGANDALTSTKIASTVNEELDFTLSHQIAPQNEEAIQFYRFQLVNGDNNNEILDEITVQADNLGDLSSTEMQNIFITTGLQLDGILPGTNTGVIVKNPNMTPGLAHDVVISTYYDTDPNSVASTRIEMHCRLGFDNHGNSDSNQNNIAGPRAIDNNGLEISAYPNGPTLLDWSKTNELQATELQFRIAEAEFNDEQGVVVLSAQENLETTAAQFNFRQIDNMMINIYRLRNMDTQWSWLNRNEALAENLSTNFRGALFSNYINRTDIIESFVGERIDNIAPGARFSQPVERFQCR